MLTGTVPDHVAWEEWLPSVGCARELGHALCQSRSRDRRRAQGLRAVEEGDLATPCRRYDGRFKGRIRPRSYWARWLGTQSDTGHEHRADWSRLCSPFACDVCRAGDDEGDCRHRDGDNGSWTPDDRRNRRVNMGDGCRDGDWSACRFPSCGNCHRSAGRASYVHVGDWQCRRQVNRLSVHINRHTQQTCCHRTGGRCRRKSR